MGLDLQYPYYCNEEYFGFHGSLLLPTGSSWHAQYLNLVFVFGAIF